MASSTVKPTITCRRVTSQGDLDEVWFMWKDVMDQKVYYPYDSNTYSRLDIEREWVNLQLPVHVAVNNDNDEILGAFILKDNQPGYGKHICNAAYMVKTNRRGQGIGSVLCLESIRIATELGYRGMQFNLVVSTNTLAVRLWKEHGFTVIGTVPGGFYLEQEDRYVDAYIYFKSLLKTEENLLEQTTCLSAQST